MKRAENENSLLFLFLGIAETAFFTKTYKKTCFTLKIIIEIL
jgi:hypothetical protein